jgi:hypothetical protein
MTTKRNNKRIYYGPEGKETSLYWTVKVSDATALVTVNGALIHALRSTAGVTIGCGLSNMAIDNADQFRHPVYLASFTKTGALLVDRLKKDGSPAHAVRYRHHYAHITDANDRGILKRMAKEDPAIMEREFTLYPPTKNRPSGKNAGKTPRERRGKTDHGKSFVPRGALARAVRAGRLHQSVAQQISDVARATQSDESAPN